MSSNYNGVTGPGATKSLVVGQFQLADTDTGAGCNGVTVSAATQPATYFFGSDPGTSNAMAGPFANSAAQGVAPNGSMEEFTAVLSTGTSTVWGIVGNITSGTNCITTGGATGD